METYFKEEEAIHAVHVKATGSASVDWSLYPIGAVVDAKVLIVKDFGAILSLPHNSVKGFVVAEQAKVNIESFPSARGNTLFDKMTRYLTPLV